MARKPTIRKNHPWLQPTPEAREFADRLNASTGHDTINGMPLPLVSAELPPETIRVRRKILRGEPLYSRIARAGKTYTSTIALLPREETIYSSTITTYRGDKIPTDPIGKLLRWCDQVVCPSCDTAIPLVSWWQHGCKNPIVARAEVFAPFAEATAGAAEAEYSEAA